MPGLFREENLIFIFKNASGKLDTYLYIYTVFVTIRIYLISSFVMYLLSVFDLLHVIVIQTVGF